MSQLVRVVDYGIGNLHSVLRAFERIGVRAELTSDCDTVAKSDLLVLPGVGAFEPCISNLRAAGLDEGVKAFVNSGRPFLGICVGMQLLFDVSNEFGSHRGLGILKGSVDPIPTARSDGGRRKVPHIGWSALQVPAARDSWKNTLFGKLAPGSEAAYFVHSFSCVPDDPHDRLADVDYEGYSVCAAVQRNNVTGVQFHPEKSGPIGLAVLAAFVDGGAREFSWTGS